MKRHFRRFLTFILLTLSCHGVSGQSAIEKYGQPVESLPSVVTFDCGFEPGSEPTSVGALGTKMWVPNMFEVQEGEDIWLYWNVLLKGEEGETFEAPLARIHIGEDEFDSVSSFLSEFQTIAGPETNHLNATVIQRLPQPEDMSGTHWLFLLKGNGFLKIVSYDPIDWVSLLACFHQ